MKAADVNKTLFTFHEYIESKKFACLYVLDYISIHLRSTSVIVKVLNT